MPENQTIPPKPQAEVIRPEITRLPEITPGRKILRAILRGAARLMVRIWTRSTVS